MQSLYLYLVSEPIFDNKAYIVTLTYYNSILKIYTSHPLPPASPGTQCEYVTT
ncbi:hypothetical protein F5Y16DRAFT_364789 [Xylariaceae sp. FL0255]|nr:hypothetical protein F5Y16DRAFT_364789 [Xylariaceae sp. FL0255]